MPAATLVVLAAAVAIGAKVGARAIPPEDAEAPKAIDSVTVGVEPAEPVTGYLRERVYTGSLVARRRSVLAFERSGKIVELLVDEGDRVAKDQPLARLDTRRLGAKRAQTQADLAVANAVLRELEAGPRSQTIAAAEAEVASLAAQSDIAEKTLRRRARLVETQAVSREEYEESYYQHRAAVARTEVAQRTLDELRAGTRVEQVDAQLAQVTSIEARLADILHELDDAVLLAPFAGQVARRRVDEGTVVAPGEGVLELVESDALEAWVGIPPDAAGRLAIGDRVAVTVGAEERGGVVRSVRPEIDADTRTRNVVLAIESPEGWVAGEVARVAIDEPVEGTGTWAPTASLVAGERGLWSVLVVEADGVVAARPVEVIESEGDRSLVRGALEAGERMVTRGSHRVVVGQRVLVAGDTPERIRPTAEPRP